MTRVGCLTVTHDSAPVIERCVAGLRALCTAHPETLEAVIVDNASTDGTPDRVKGIRVVKLPANKGFGAGTNAAFRALTRPVDALLLLNPDVQVSPATLATLVTAFRSNTASGILVPRLRAPNYAMRVPLEPSVGKLDAVSFLTGARRWRRRRLARLADSSARVTVRDAYAEGACMLVRADVFATLQGFDERFFLYFEDADFSRRLEQLGRTIVLVGDAIAEELSVKGSRAVRDGTPQQEDLARFQHYLAAEIEYHAKWHGEDFARFAAWMRTRIGFALQGGRLAKRFGTKDAVDACRATIERAVAELA